MSKRYGRNQKRRHIHEIDRLEREIARLEDEAKGGFAKASGLYQNLDLMLGPIISTNIEDIENGFTKRRTADIHFFLTPTVFKKLQYAMAYSMDTVEWRGIVWNIRECSINGRDPFNQSAIAGDDTCDIKLEAIGSRDQRSSFPYASRKIAA